MRRLFSPSTLVPFVMIAAVAAMVVSANIREGRRERRPSPVAALLGGPNAPPSSREGLAGRIAAMDARLAADAGDVEAAVLLADALLRQGRISGSAAPSMRAEQVLRQALREAPGNYDALRMQAAVYLSQHRFREAIEVSERCREMRPADAVNFGAIGDAYIELGDYPQAFDAFDRMMTLRPSAAAYSRVAYARELQGNLPGALESMRMAADASEGGDLEAMAWYRAQVGELYLRMGRHAEALQFFAAASQAFQGHPFAVIGYAKTLEATGKKDEAKALLEDVAKRTPTPDVYARLGDLAAAGGSAAEAEKYWALAEAAWRTEAPEPGHLARFLAERNRKIDEAVTIAESAAQTRNDIFTNDAVAWAYFKAGRTADAKRAIRNALRTGTKDPDILRHARAIEQGPSKVAMR